MGSNSVPFQRLEERLAGKPYRQVLLQGVPNALVRPLREWVAKALKFRNDLARRVTVRLDIVGPSNESYTDLLCYSSEKNLLSIADAILQLHPDWETPSHTPKKTTTYGRHKSTSYGTSLSTACSLLDELLIDGASELRVDMDLRHLVRRVDQTASEAAMSSMKSASDEASDHLRSAWVATYGLSPDPDTAYRECVRAVEAVACPLILKRQAEAGKATLGTVIGQLKAHPSLWNITFVDNGGVARDAMPIAVMSELLWMGQVSRHAGGPKNRRQTQAEAEAAVHLATTIVQWLSTGVLTPKQ